MLELYNTKSPILFIIYNRPEITNRTFNEIKKAKPKKLYIAADGPKNYIDNKTCTTTREIIYLIDWECEVKTLFRESNLGCKNAVSSAIDWFFSNEEYGIILEDDCLPSIEFFCFCDELLMRYEFDQRISMISGCNFQNGKKWSISSYYFSNLSHVWGWASWRRVWQDYDVDLKNYNVDFAKTHLKKIFINKKLVKKWMNIFELLKDGKIDTWDYQLAFTNFFKERVSVIPNVNMISNIGFGKDATHTKSVTDKNANIPHSELGNIVHPDEIKVMKSADVETLLNDFYPHKNRLKKYIIKMEVSLLNSLS